jgi:ribosomal protection tetracycline resistance protein
MRTLNLGILAHVDAGKTSLTERLLFAAGVIDAVGRVDDGTTQTDTLALERERGITIRTAVASFAVGDVTVNLIDTPGHPDFIAEVERALGVLDGAVLVVSAVEGVQAQTRVLWRALRRLGVPTLFFVNKLDRRGADPERVVAEIGAKLTASIVAPHTPRARRLELLAEHDDRLLRAWLDDEPVPEARLRRALAAQSRRALVHPVLLGSAITGAGVDVLMSSLPELLPSVRPDDAGPLSAAVFKVEREGAGERIAWVRVHSGALRARERISLGDGTRRKVTALCAFAGGEAVPCDSLAAGQIGKVSGLGEVRIGDVLGAARPGASEHHFAPPTLATVVVPRHECDRGVLRSALAWLAEQDPLVDLRQDDVRQELTLSLYGEVQKEVIAATLAREFGVEVEFRASTTICIERVLGTGDAVETKPRRRTPERPFFATIGLRVEPAPAGSGVAFRLEVELGSMPWAFFKATEEGVRATLRQGGLFGWEVPDCAVTMTHSGYWPRQSHAHATFDKGMSSVASDFRQLAPLVLMDALARARTQVCEPIHRFHLELPADALGALLPILAGVRAIPESPDVRGPLCTLQGEIPAARVHALRLQLASLTRGEGALECAFERFEPVRGAPPTRPRTDLNPLDRKEYLLRLTRRGL